MKFSPGAALFAGATFALAPALATAQEISITRSVLPEMPYTLIFPAEMQASGGGDEPVTINHPNAPLQCEMSVVAVEDTSWTAQSALDELDDERVATAWAETLPGFSVANKALTQYQDNTALSYDGTSTDSAMGMPLTLVHTETVSSGRGYTLDCIYATDQATQARPLVDFIIANFSTRADADCCVGMEPSQPDQPPAQ